MIKVLIVEDSRVTQEFLTYVLKSDPDIDVVGVVDDGINALQAVKEKHPDVITMDIHMPQMGGFEATRLIMENAPRPIVIVSASTGAKDVASTFQALEAGALAVVLTPPGIGHPDHEAAARELVQTVKLMSEIKVVRRFSHTVKPLSSVKTVVRNLKEAGEFQLIAIGTSTGGPPVLNKLLSLLPADLPVPLLIVQHISPGFTEGFVNWLSGTSGFPVHIAIHGQQLLPGHAYVAPDNFHMGIVSGFRIALNDHAPEYGVRPSAAYLFHTVAQVLGPHAIGVLLTGMGKDGARELLEMKNAGALTIVQDEASSIVFGMAGEAVKLGAAEYILPPEAIAAMLVSLLKTTSGKPG
jgi:two-component system chemotaxis response regulator CheB